MTETSSNTSSGATSGQPVSLTVQLLSFDLFSIQTRAQYILQARKLREEHDAEFQESLNIDKAKDKARKDKELREQVHFHDCIALYMTNSALIVATEASSKVVLFQ